jgi:hypothetical protein
MDTDKQSQVARLEEAMRDAQPAWAKTPSILGEPVPISRVDSVQSSQDYSISEFNNMSDLPDTPEFEFPADGGGQGGGGTFKPWDAYDIEEDGGNYECRIWPGTVNGILPTNPFYKYELTGAGPHVLKVVITTDGKAVQSLVFGEGQAAPQVPALFALPTTVEVVFGVLFEGKFYRAIGAGSITIESELVIVKDKSTAPSVSQLVYENWYVWTVRQ